MYRHGERLKHKSLTKFIGRASKLIVGETTPWDVRDGTVTLSVSGNDHSTVRSCTPSFRTYNLLLTVRFHKLLTGKQIFRNLTCLQVTYLTDRVLATLPNLNFNQPPVEGTVSNSLHPPSPPATLTLYIH